MLRRATSIKSPKMIALSRRFASPCSITLPYLLADRIGPFKTIDLGFAALGADENVIVHLFAVACWFHKPDRHFPAAFGADHLRGNRAWRSSSKHRFPFALTFFSATAKVSEKDKRLETNPGRIITAALPSNTLRVRRGCVDLFVDNSCGHLATY
jgi:hypothetical protein